MSDSGTNSTVSETYATNAVATATTALYSELTTYDPSSEPTEFVTVSSVSDSAPFAARSAERLETKDQTSGAIPAKSAATAR